jgi:hypothetical protein
MYVYFQFGRMKGGRNFDLHMAERHRSFQGTEHSRETTKSKKITQNTIRERT